MKGQPLLLTAVGIGATLLFLQGGTVLGPMGAVLNLLTPVAAAYLSLRFGLRTGVIVVAVTSLLLMQLAPLYTLTAYLALFGVGSLLLPLMLLQQQPWDRAVMVSVVGALIATVAMATVAVVASEGSFDHLAGQVVQAEVDHAMQIYREAGLSESQLQELQEFVTGLATFIKQTFYGLFVAGVLLIQFLCLAILQRLKNNHYQISGVPFAVWRLPAGLIWALIVSGFAAFAPLESLALVGRNLLAVLLPLYFLQGLAVVNSFLQRKAYPPAVKGLIYAMVFILNPMPIIITGVGVFDLWIDFRRPRQKD
jgi:uncharacterized protein YybS (DUF2232 family)